MTWIDVSSLVISFLAEFSTMAGRRRLCDAVKKVLTSGGNG